MHCGNASMMTRERPWLKNCWVTIAPPQDVLVLRSENLAKNPGISSVLVFICFHSRNPMGPLGLMLCWHFNFDASSLFILLRALSSLIQLALSASWSRSGLQCELHSNHVPWTAEMLEAQCNAVRPDFLSAKSTDAYRLHKVTNGHCHTEMENADEWHCHATYCHIRHHVFFWPRSKQRPSRNAKYPKCIKMQQIKSENAQLALLWTRDPEQQFKLLSEDGILPGLL